MWKPGTRSMRGGKGPEETEGVWEYQEMSGGLAGSVKRKLSEEMLNHGLLNSPVYPCFQGLGCM